MSNIDISKMTLPEIFEHVAGLKPAQRLVAIQQISKISQSFTEILRLVYHRDFHCDLPEGNPPFKPLEIPKNFGYNRLHAEMRKFQYIVATSKSKATPAKREQIFIEMLESVSPEEAEIVLMIKNKKLTYKGFSRKVVEQAIPQIFVGETAMGKKDVQEQE
jgi:hypothetical protein